MRGGMALVTTTTLIQIDHTGRNTTIASSTMVATHTDPLPTVTMSGMATTMVETRGTIARAIRTTILEASLATHTTTQVLLECLLLDLRATPSHLLPIAIASSPLRATSPSELKSLQASRIRVAIHTDRMEVTSDVDRITLSLLARLEIPVVAGAVVLEADTEALSSGSRRRTDRCWT